MGTRSCRGAVGSATAGDRRGRGLAEVARGGEGIVEIAAHARALRF